jgi:hypothetical protein
MICLRRTIGNCAGIAGDGMPPLFPWGRVGKVV